VGGAATHAFTVTTATAGGACVGEAHVVTVAGEAAGEVWEELGLALQGVYEEGGQKVAVDLTELEGFDPAMLDLVLRHAARFRARGGDVVVACPSDAQAGELRTERRIDDALAALLSTERS
jgi:anti-anti-sigma regulatory factor